MRYVQIKDTSLAFVNLCMLYIYSYDTGYLYKEEEYYLKMRSGITPICGYHKDAEKSIMGDGNVQT